MLLLQAFDQFPNNWQKISSVLGSKKTSSECRDRHSALKHCNFSGHFSNEEDQLLKKGVAEFGKSFALIKKKYFKHRTTKQLRDRYMKTLVKKNKPMMTFKAYQHEFVIEERIDEEPETTRVKDRNSTHIQVGCLEREEDFPTVRRNHEVENRIEVSPPKSIINLKRSE